MTKIYGLIKRAVHDRSWPPGPWDGEPDRVEWRVNDVPCLALRNQMGVWCGYAGVPPGHPWYGVRYRDLPDLNIHGGLTYSDECQSVEHNGCEVGICHTAMPGEPDSVWWLGFDCAHYGDLSPGYPEFSAPNARYRDLAYVRQQVAGLVREVDARRAEVIK